MYPALRRLLFRLAPETAHRVTINALAGVSRSKTLCALIAAVNRADAPTRVMGVDFPNPVGLAAGFDKDAAAAGALAALGFGHLELGSVTPLAQPGNPPPRLFRLINERALINRLGFNSRGLENFNANLARADRRIVVGVNLGKNAATALDKAADDYCAGVAAVYARADYIAINISSPNTRSLRELQNEDALSPLLARVDRARTELADAHGRRVPLVLKIAPDLNDGALAHIADAARAHRIDGIAATNTSVARDGVEHHAHAAEPGGLSGAPLADAATDTVARLYQNLQGEIPIIGVGGIDDADAALAKFQAGADLVQLHTGFVFHGPKLIRDIVKTLRAELGERTMREYLNELRGDGDDGDLAGDHGDIAGGDGDLAGGDGVAAADRAVP